MIAGTLNDLFLGGWESLMGLLGQIGLVGLVSLVMAGPLNDDPT